MKRLKVLILLTIALIFCSTIAFAEQAHESKAPMMQKSMNKAKMAKHYMGSMMGMMVKKQMVATEDGAVIVMIGNKLLKYDSDLNLVKEVELQIDVQSWYKTMKRIKQECRRYKELLKAEKKEQPEKE